jgi:phage tail sheath protein FI
MPSYRTPGVYVEEISPLPAAVNVPDSAVVGFFGRTERGPLLQPQTIGSLLEFERLFGSAQPLLHAALQLFYANGGGACVVSSVGPAAPTLAALHAGLDTLAAQAAVTLLVCPEACSLPRPDYAQLVQAMLAQCAASANRFAILDLYDGGQSRSELAAHRALFGSQHLMFGAAYAPFVRSAFAPGLALPPSAAVAGAYASTDRQRGIWKAPANVSLQQISAPLLAFSDRDQQDFNIDAAGGHSINLIRSFSGRGCLIWGARTLAGNDNEWRYVPVRRLCSLVLASLQAGSEWAVFEPNEARTWSRLSAMAENFLIQLWREGALQGSKTEQAFYVRCGLHQTMTAADLAAGRLIVELGLAPVRPAEFIVLHYALQLAVA